jgi:hypothetical protein
MIHKEDFECKLSDVCMRESAGNPYNIQFRNPFVEDMAIRFELRRTDKEAFGSKRSEVSWIIPGELKQGAERIIKFKMFLPDSPEECYEPDMKDGEACGSEILFQLHNMPDKDEEWTYPPFYVKTTGDKYEVGIVWDEKEKSRNAELDAENKVIRHVTDQSFLEDRGKWVEWMVNIKYGWLPEHDSFTRVYKNGQLMFEHNGPNTTNDLQEPYFKIGIYKWDWAQPNYCNSILEKRVVYFDKVRIVNMD